MLKSNRDCDGVNRRQNQYKHAATNIINSHYRHSNIRTYLNATCYVDRLLGDGMSNLSGTMSALPLRVIGHRITSSQSTSVTWRAVEQVGQEVKPVLRVATFCAGSDGFIWGLGALGQSMQAEWGQMYDIEHVASVDISKDCLKFIKANHKPKILVSDMDYMTAEQVWDHMSAEFQDVPKPHIIVIGISCRDISLKNAKRSRNGDILTTGGGSTGLTFHLLCKFLDSDNGSEVVEVLMENVATMFHSATRGQIATYRQQVQSALDARRFFEVAERKMDPYPSTSVHRPRWWAAYLRLPLQDPNAIPHPLNPYELPKIQDIINFFNESLDASHKALAFTNRMQVLRETFKPDDDPEVVQQEAYRLARFYRLHRNNPTQPNQNFSWVNEHLKYFRDNGVAWVTPIFHKNHCGRCQYPGYEVLEDSCGSYAEMSDRQKHMLLFLDSAFPLTYETQIQITDFSQDGNYIQPVEYNSCPVIAPHSTMVLRRMNKSPRLVLGTEKMMLQGMPHDFDKAGLSQAQLGKIAGNAFHIVDAMQMAFPALYAASRVLS